MTDETQTQPQAKVTIKVIPSPKNPSQVADEFLADRGWWTQEPRDDDPEDTRTVLRARVQSQTFYVWDAGSWKPLSRHDLTVAVTEYTRDAFYVDGNGTAHPWNPTTGSLREVVEALMVHPELQLVANVRAPAWISDEDVIYGAHPNSLVAVVNGLVDVSHREGGARVVYEHTPDFWNHSTLAVRFSGNAARPERWLRFLDEVWGGDAESITQLQEAFGYIVSGRTDLQKAFALVGPKRSGKGTIARVLSVLVGRDAYASTSISSLGRNFGLQALLGKSLTVISDARVDSRASVADAVERLLSITGEDYVPVDRKFKDPVTVQLQTRFLVLTNEMPKLTDAAGALSSRFVFIPMTRSFYGKEDPGLTDELTHEAAGILDWALDGLETLEARGYFGTTAAGDEMAREMEMLGSPVKAFVEERCIVGPNESVAAATLYGAWVAWAANNGHREGSSNRFGRDLRTVVPDVDRRKARVSGTSSGTSLVNTYFGVGLR
jgi:putative DNA primase/helicase